MHRKRTNSLASHIHLSWLILTALGALGCADSATGPQPERTSSRSDPAFQTGFLWANGRVPVCYHPTKGNRPELLERAREILKRDGWSAVAKIDFVGWDACGATPVSGGQIRVHFESDPESDDYWGWSGVGPKGNKFTDMYLRDDLTGRDPAFVHFRYQVLHEFGHAIGLHHEQRRVDNIYAHGSYHCDEWDGDEWITLIGSYQTPYFDTQSVMSYCSDWAQALSPGDVAGAQAMYGRREEMWRGQNPSNNAIRISLGGDFLMDVFGKTHNAFFVHDDRQLHRLVYNPLSDTWSDDAVTSGSWTSAPPGAPVAAISRKTGTMDVFYVGDNGAVFHNRWGAGEGWITNRVLGTYNHARPGSQIAAVSSSPGAMNVFYAGTDGNLWWIHWTEAPQNGGGWSLPVAIVDDGSVPPETKVTAVSRNPDRIDVFYIGGDGAVHNASCFGASGSGSCFYEWEPQGSWPHHALGTSGACGVASTRAGISAVARTPEHIDVFHVNQEGTLCVTPWNPTEGWPSGGGVTVGQTGALSAAGHLTAVATSRRTLDVFYVGTNRHFRRVAWRAPSATALNTTTSPWISVTIGDDEYSHPGSALGVIGTEGSFHVLGNVRVPGDFVLETYSRQWWGKSVGADPWTWTQIN